MNSNKNKSQNKFLINIYSIIAVLIVIIPEWIAERILILDNLNRSKKIPVNSSIWSTKADLLLSTLSIRELRLKAKELSIYGYSSDNRFILSKRILRRIEKTKLCDQQIFKTDSK